MRIRDRLATGQPTCSFEFFPPKTAAGVDSLFATIADLREFAPTFVSVTCELIAFIKEDPEFDFCLGGACYPEKHIEARDPDIDLANLQQKVAAGVDFLVTQLFFDNAYYFAFVERARAAGIDLPIVPGIMPVTNVAQIERFTTMCGATIPQELRAILAACDDEEAVVAAGIEWATAQCRDLLAHGAPGLHFYTLNRSRATAEIVRNLGEALPVAVGAR
jgi:methylenetetrahydrofolate reductase (NADPH)